MQDTLKKVGFCLQNNPRTTRIMRLKIWQILVQSVLSLITGLLSVSNPGYCSSPLPVFLLGLFGIYIAGVTLNFFVCFGRSCEYYGTDGCASSFKFCMRGVNFIYLPLYWLFCILEFIWYVLGAYWYARQGDCSSAFSSGYNAAIGLIGFYFVMLMLYFIGFIVFLCYLKYKEVEKPEVTVKEQDPVPPQPAENTNPQQDYYNNNPNFNQGYPNDGRQYPRNYGNERQNYPENYGDGRQQYPEHYGNGRQQYPENYGDGRYPDGRQNYGNPDYGNGRYPGQDYGPSDPNRFNQDPRYNTDFIQNPQRDPGNFYNTNPLDPPRPFDNQFYKPQ